jgi:hypothetical protein
MVSGSPPRLVVNVCEPVGCPEEQLASKILSGIEPPAAAKTLRAPTPLRKSLLETVIFLFFSTMLHLLFYFISHYLV